MCLFFSIPRRCSLYMLLKKKIENQHHFIGTMARRSKNGRREMRKRYAEAAKKKEVELKKFLMRSRARVNRSFVDCTRCVKP